MAKKKRTGIMIPRALDEHDLKTWLSEGPVIVQPKEFGAHVRWTGTVLLTSTGNLITGLPHIEEELSQNLPGLVLEGEVVAKGWTDSQVSGAMRRKAHNLHPEHEHIELVIFDLIHSSFDLYQSSMPLQERVGRIEDLPQGLTYRPIRSVLAENLDQVNGLMKLMVEKDGHEGIVIKHPGKKWQEGRARWCMKSKPRRFDTYRLVEVLPRKGRAHEGAGSLLVSDREGCGFKIGSLALDEDQRQALWRHRSSLAGEKLVVSYPAQVGGTSAGTFKEFVSPDAQKLLEAF